MPRNEGKVRSGRKPPRDIPNRNGNINTGEGNFSKSVMAKKKKPAVAGKETGSQRTSTDQEEEGEDAFLDRLLLVQSDLSSLVRQPWVPRFQKVLSSLSMGPENQWGWSLEGESVSPVSKKEKIQIGSPEETKMVSLISPSPLLSWRANCNIERGRQLFLLTPLPIMKTSTKCTPSML